jgi:hypothetical protein
MATLLVHYVDYSIAATGSGEKRAERACPRWTATAATRAGDAGQLDQHNVASAAAAPCFLSNNNNNNNRNNGSHDKTGYDDVIIINNNNIDDVDENNDSVKWEQHQQH